MTRLIHVTTVPQSFLFLRHQIETMKSHGIEVHGITSPGPLLDVFAKELGIEIHPVAMPRKITPLQDLQALAELAGVIRSIQPDIVHAHTPKGGLLGMLGATMARVPNRVYHMRGLLTLTATGRRKELFTWVERLTCALAHEVICVGHSLRAEALSQRLAPASKMHVMAGGSGQGVDAMERFFPSRRGLAAQAKAIRAEHGIPNNAFVVGFVGRLVRDKGIVELAHAWQQVIKKHPKAHLLVVGLFAERDAVPEEIAKILKAMPSVHLAGATQDPAPFYKAMNLVTLPTYREGFPNVPLEAAAMKLPVVSTRVTGAVDAVLDGVTGALVPAKDAQALADALCRYVEDRALAKAHGAAGRERVLANFAPDQISEEIYQLYQHMLSHS